MSSGLIQRRTMAAVASSRTVSGMMASQRNLSASQHRDAHPNIRHPGQHPTSRGLAYHTEGRTTSSEQQQRQQHKKTTQSLEGPPQNQTHQEHLQARRHQHQTRRSSTTHAHESSETVAGDSEGNPFGDNSYSVMASQKVVNEAVEEWAINSTCPETRLQKAVNRFRNRFFVDELPCRTRKSVAEAAAAGKGYITADDVSRVFETISDETTLLTEDEAHAIIRAAWSKQPTGRATGYDYGGVEGPPQEARNAAAAAGGDADKISTEAFIRVMEGK